MFDAEVYGSLLERLIQSDLQFSIDWQNVKGSGVLLLRHDVDFSVDYAHAIAKKEFDRAVKSTFFFMLTSNMYNLLSPKNRDLVEDIAGMGHKISLHFDPTCYADLTPFTIERCTFEELFNVEVDIVSIHRPGTFLEQNDIDLLHQALETIKKQTNLIE